MKNFKIVFKNLVVLMVLTFMTNILTACGGNSSNPSSPVDSVSKSANATIIPESVKVETKGDTAVVSYQTSAPVQKSYVISSNFSFNNAPLWSDFHSTSSTNGLNHSAEVKIEKNLKLMIYNSASDKYDNAGKGIEVK